MCGVTPHCLYCDSLTLSNPSRLIQNSRNAHAFLQHEMNLSLLSIRHSYPISTLRFRYVTNMTCGTKVFPRACLRKYTFIYINLPTNYVTLNISLHSAQGMELDFFILFLAL